MDPKYKGFTVNTVVYIKSQEQYITCVKLICWNSQQEEPFIMRHQLVQYYTPTQWSAIILSPIDHSFFKFFLNVTLAY